MSHARGIHAFPTRGERGFSLVELVLVIIILALIAAVSSTILSGGFNAYFRQRDVSDADWQGRLALQRLNRDLRTVRSPTPADLVMSPATQITLVNAAGSTVTYNLSGNVLMRNGQPLADGISALSFSYLRRDGKTLAADATQVYYIGASFTVTRGGANLPARTLIKPRRFP